MKQQREPELQYLKADYARKHSEAPPAAAPLPSGPGFPFQPIVQAFSVGMVNPHDSPTDADSYRPFEGGDLLFKPMTNWIQKEKQPLHNPASFPRVDTSQRGASFLGIEYSRIRLTHTHGHTYGSRKRSTDERAPLYSLSCSL